MKNFRVNNIPVALISITIFVSLPKDGIGYM